MDFNYDRNGKFQNNNTAVFSTPRPDLIEMYMRFFMFKFHFIAIPVGIIVAAVHLKYGIQYLDECPIEPMITVYMIVHAAVGLFAIITVFVGVLIARGIYSRPQIENNEKIARCLIIAILIFQVIVALFSLSWIIAGSVWIFSISGTQQGSNPADTTTYCQTHLYRAAFALIIINYILHTFIVVAIIAGYIFWRRKYNLPPFFQRIINWL